MKSQLYSNENYVLLNWQVRVCLFFCYCQEISVCEMLHTDLSSTEGNWPSQLHHGRCLSVAAIPFFLSGIWGTTQSLESLFQRTRVFLLLNSNSCCRCDWKSEAVHPREEGGLFLDDLIFASWWLLSDICVHKCLTAPGQKKKKKKKRLYTEEESVY